MSGGVAGLTGQPYAFNPFLLKGSAAAFDQASHTDFDNTNSDEVINDSNPNTQNIKNTQASGPGQQVQNPKALQMQDLTAGFQATVESMRMKIQLSGEMGNVHNNWAKQAEFLVSAFAEGQGFIDSIAEQFPDEATMPPEIRAMIDEISRLQDSCITLLNSCLGTSFTKDEFRDLIGAKSGEKGGGTGEADDHQQTQQGQQAQEVKNGKDSAQEKLEETIRSLMADARSFIVAAKSDPVMGPEFASKAMTKIQEAMLILDTVDALRKAMGGAGQGGNPNSILGNPQSGMEALGAINIGGANANGGNLGGTSGGTATPASMPAEGGFDMSAFESQNTGGLGSEADSLDDQREELERLAEEAMEAGAKPDPKKDSGNNQQLAVTSVMFAPQSQNNLFSGNSPTFAMMPRIA